MGTAGQTGNRAVGQSGNGRAVGASEARLPGRFVFLVVLSAGCGGGNVPLPQLLPSTIGDTSGLVARGEYIVRTLAVCGHCHAESPKDPDGPLSGGMTFRNWRLGTIRGSNLTPDSATGLGTWSDAEIVRAIRSGEDRDGHIIAPVMPYQWFQKMSDRDALAVARYLKQLKPVHNPLENKPNFAYQFAKSMFLKPKKVPRSLRAPARGPDANYGRYLTNNVSLCADCHTRRHGLQAAPDRNSLLAGDATPPSAFPANPSNITPDTLTGIGKWSEADFLRAMRTGITPAGDTLHPFMPWQQFKRMKEDDLRAIYLYLRTVTAIRNRVPRRRAQS
jgi:mono/diheme cytochrome c family protein